MGAISALSTTGRTLRRNTVLFAASFVGLLVNVILTGVIALIPSEVAGLLSLPLSGLTYLFTPFLLGGMFAMADEGLDGTTRLGTFVRGGRDYYVTLFGAMLLFGVLVSVVMFAVVLAVAIVAVFVVGMSTPATGGAFTPMNGNLAIFAFLGLVGVLATLLPVFFLQLYPSAIVVSDLGIVAAFKRSAGLVRRNVASTFGFLLVSAVVGLFAGVTTFLATMFGGIGGSLAMGGTTSQNLGVGALVAGGVLAVVVSVVASAFGSVYQVAFYDDLLDSLD